LNYIFAHGTCIVIIAQLAEANKSEGAGVGSEMVRGLGWQSECGSNVGRQVRANWNCLEWAVGPGR
jgi:hypothetical protein